ncbi:MAG: SDR family oxidoreductase [Syntrophales bacterium]|nr:SDR family oxidoreductase [Syntrophales bacterium]
MTLANLQGKIVVITGASSGIGAALAKAFSKVGARVALAARREDRLKQIAADCPSENLIVAADVTDPNGRRSIIERTLDRWRRLDILVNNAGAGLYGKFSDTTEEEWRRLFEINFFSAVLLTKDALGIMLPQRQGIIINIASIGGLIAHSTKVTPYVASKHALVGFSRGLAKDLAGTGIRVLAICPHITSTDFFGVSVGADDMAPEIEKYRSVMDTADEVAAGIIAQLDSERLVVFPTKKPARVYEKQRDI